LFIERQFLSLFSIILKDYIYFGEEPSDFLHHGLGQLGRDFLVTEDSFDFLSKTGVFYDGQVYLHRIPERAIINS